ncbi:MAG: glycoside hydrolase family 28 protein, partial [Verrucomicrobia bacterium]|nr:glycoside hydrolase family 28 protein [Verrucomicrobiota bacterium]
MNTRNQPFTTSRRRFLQSSAVAISVAALGRVVRAGGLPEPTLPFPMTVPTAPEFPARTFDVRDYGAVAGGETLNTKAIAAAIAACAKAGGGRVLVPAGVWLTGPVHLRSKVELHVTESAELRFSRNYSDYLPVVYMQRGGVRCFNYSPLIYACDCTDVAVTGPGTLNGQGDAWWDWKNKQPGMKRLFEAGAKGVPVEQRVFGTEQDGVRPPFIQTIDCRNVLLEGFTLRDGPSWNIHPVTCENLIVRKVSVIAKGPNNDGIDPDSCKNVLIEDCLLDTGDDCICLKAGRDQDGWSVGRPCENILIRRCRTKRGHGGVVIGSEMSASVRNVFVHDCEFDGTERGVRIKSLPGRGGFIENVWFQ